MIRSARLLLHHVAKGEKLRLARGRAATLREYVDAVCPADRTAVGVRRTVFPRRGRFTPGVAESDSPLSRKREHQRDRCAGEEGT